MKDKFKAVSSHEPKIFGLNRKWAWYGGLFLLVLLIQIFSMPAQEYGGDPSAIRMATDLWVREGRLDIPADQASRMGERGQFFIQNLDNYIWHSKYGIVNSILYLPSALIESERFTFSGNVLSRTLILNGYNLFLTLAILTVLVLVCSLYTQNVGAISLFVLSSFYSTFLWCYLRAQTTEIFQVLFFLCFYYCSIRYNRTLNRKWLKGSFFFTGTLSLMKPFYLPMIPLLWLWIAVTDYGKPIPSTWERVADFLQVSFRRLKGDYFARLVLPSLLIVGLFLIQNRYLSGSFWATGYSQWKAEEGSLSGSMIDAIIGISFRTNKSIFLHFPLLIFAALGIRKFTRRFPFDSLAIFTAFFGFYLALSRFSRWQGDWCYGPRYLLFVLPVASLPFILVIESWIQQWKEIKKVWASIPVLLALLYSAQLQMNVNAVSYFLYFELYGIFEFKESGPVADFFMDRPLGVIYGDLLKFQKTGKLSLLDALSREISPDQVNAVSNALRERLRSNYYWF